MIRVRQTAGAQIVERLPTVGGQARPDNPRIEDITECGARAFVILDDEQFCAFRLMSVRKSYHSLRGNRQAFRAVVRIL